MSCSIRLVILQGLNCTVMELKRELGGCKAMLKVCLNCTVMELKQNKSVAANLMSLVLIVPLWN